ncbi:MAG: hypothetical protein F4X89_04660 [Dehalococcoidia bacterium]|nr:hypothetical protein [Dehalococcoidia bacterium]
MMASLCWKALAVAACAVALAACGGDPPQPSPTPATHAHGDCCVTGQHPHPNRPLPHWGLV